MRPSDRKLAAALRASGLEAMAVQAEAGDYNEFFGPHALPMHQLADDLVAARKAADSPERKREINELLKLVTTGEFDAGLDEANEWQQSDEGQALARELGGTE